MQRLRAWAYEWEAQRRLESGWWTRQQAPTPTAQQQYALMQAGPLPSWMAVFGAGLAGLFGPSRGGAL